MNILYITGGTPWPPNIGVNQRTFLIYKALSECGNVHMIINSKYVNFSMDEKVFMQTNYGLLYLLNPLSPILKTNQYDRKLGNLYKCSIEKIENYFGPYLCNKANAPIVSKTIAENKYSVVVSRYLRSTINTGLLNFTPNILDVDDLHFDVVKSTLNLKHKQAIKKIFLFFYYRIIKMLEIHYLNKIDYLWFAKEGDKQFIDHQRSCVLPNIPYVNSGHNNSFCKEPENDHTALFIGSMKHEINVKGIDRFIKDIWPNIIMAKPDAVLRVVGTGMSQKQRDFWNQFSGVQAVGFVENIGSEYHNCAFTVIPLAEGGGTKIKLLESLQHGKTCVADVHSFRGFEKIFKDGEDIFVTDSDDMLVEKCLQMYGDPQKRKKMAQNGKKKVDKYFTYENFKKIVKNTVSHVAREGEYVKPKATP